MPPEQDKAFTGAIPELYARHLVPLLFDPYARDIANRIKSIDPRRILEIAAGTGVVTKALAAALPHSAQIVATDLNPAMLDVARSDLSADKRIQWKQADALALPFEDQSFDVVVCQFGVMFFPDRSQGFREVFRVLRTSGAFVFNVWDDLQHNEFADVVTQALEQVFPRDPPRFLARIPHGYHDSDEIQRELLATGFKQAKIEPLECVSRCTSPCDAAVGYCQGTPLHNEIVARDPSRLEEAVRRATEALANRFGNGPIEGQIRALIVTATR